jgi:hypothetical protein
MSCNILFQEVKPIPMGRFPELKKTKLSKKLTGEYKNSLVKKAVLRSHLF